ncbi:MAG: hypothetical protein NWE95_08165 [Candidatus Bathyarchaeota archaeon]|nr:hypothetical protein [Candidatus Bathyarchaeota archaeon]
MKVYIGMKEKTAPEIFEAENQPTKQTHPKYDFVYGPFRTFDDAKRYIDAMGGLACGEG